MFSSGGGAGYEQDSAKFVLDSRYNVESEENPKIIPTWKEASKNGDLDPTKYPLVIMEDFKRRSSMGYLSSTERRTQMDEVDLLVEYVRKGGGLLIMDSPSFGAELGVEETASIPRIKHLIRHVDTKLLKEIKETILNLDDEKEIENILYEYLINISPDLEGFISK